MAQTTGTENRMRPIAFTNPGRFHRGNLHTHSTGSDGVLSPGEVCRRYCNEGYDFLCLSDHFIGRYGYPISDTTEYRTNRFTTILGAEMHTGAMANGSMWHILAVGLPTDFTPPNSPDFTPRDGQETGPEIARRCREAGAFVAIAHPQWSGLTLDDALSIDEAHAVEIYNHGCAVESDRGDGCAMLDLLLGNGSRLGLIATDDAHFAFADHFGGWVMVKAEQNDPEQLLDALKAGAFYSSQGPEIHDVELAEDAVRVTSSQVDRVIVQADGIDSAVTFGSDLTEATVPLGRCRNSPWLRVTVVDSTGRRAWSNPIWRRG